MTISPPAARRWRPSSLFPYAMLMWLVLATPCAAQGRKPVRVEVPEFSSNQFDGIFFSDAASQLQGELPSEPAAMLHAAEKSAAASVSGSSERAEEGQSWQKLISATSLEDLVKGAKLRLDRIVTTPAAFQGGGYLDARREFSLVTVLFAVIENYPGEVRWQESAAAARDAFARAAANTKIASPQVYREAKQRLLDLGDLTNGATLESDVRSELNWSRLIDRGPMMQLLKWAQQEHVAKYAASEAEFADNRDAVKRYAELIALLGELSVAEDMPDAADDDYVAFARAMIEQAQAVVLAVETDDPELARRASSQLGQSCTNCHDNFR